jgi:hypothetical protein
MCATQHTTIDRDTDTWTVAKLADLKRSHEAVYTAAVDRLRRQVGDVNEGVSYTPAANGRAILPDADLTADEMAESCSEINRFAQRLAKIPADARSLLALIVGRADATSISRHPWPAEVQIPVPVLKSLADCGATKLRRHVEVLEHFDLLNIEQEPFEGPPLYLAGNSTPGVGWELLHDIRHLAGNDHSVIRRILCDLDFSALDAKRRRRRRVRTVAAGS